MYNTPIEMVRTFDAVKEDYDYEPQEWCECGQRDCWEPVTLQLPPKMVWRCKYCNAIRLKYRRKSND